MLLVDCDPIDEAPDLGPADPQGRPPPRHQGRRRLAPARLRAAVPAGSVFLAEGTHEDTANVLTGGSSRCTGSGRPARADRMPPHSQPAVEGLAEMPPSAPLPIPPREVT